MSAHLREVVYLYNCRRCKKGRRVSYWQDPKRRLAGAERIDSATGKTVSAGVWVEWSGANGKTYGGDPLGLCDGCGRAMDYGQLRAYTAPDVPCNSLCTGARGFQCTCSCGGKNHGSSWGSSA